MKKRVERNELLEKKLKWWDPIEKTYRVLGKKIFSMKWIKDDDREIFKDT